MTRNTMALETLDDPLRSSSLLVQVGGIIIGQLALGFAADRIGRKWGSVMTAGVMLVGGILLAAANGPDVRALFIMYTISQVYAGAGSSGRSMTVVSGLACTAARCILSTWGGQQGAMGVDQPHSSGTLLVCCSWLSPVIEVGKFWWRLTSGASLGPMTGPARQAHHHAYAAQCRCDWRVACCRAGQSRLCVPRVCPQSRVRYSSMVWCTTPAKTARSLDQPDCCMTCDSAPESRGIL